MPPFPPWADLPPELLCRIGDGLDLKCYASARGACTAWRCALAPPSPSLLLLLLDGCPSAASLLLTRRSFQLKPIPIPSEGRCVVGSSNGWLALSRGEGMFSLFNPVTAAEIVLPPLIYRSRWAPKSKLVFAPSPASDDFIAALICDMDRLAYVTAGARRWAVLDPVRLARGDQLVDVVYHENGRVYCLTHHGDVHVLHLPERRRRKPFVDDDPSSLPEIPPVFSLWGGRSASQVSKRLDMIRRMSSGPDLNAPATVEPLLFLAFDPATRFTPLYHKVSGFTSAKNLVFCEGDLYQIWRNTSCTVTVRVPGGGHLRVEEDQVFVLRYYPQRQPCWDAVTNLGGYSVFLGRNNAVSMYAQDFVGLKGDCVYWIGGSGRDRGMVFDMATGRSTACLPAAGASPQSTVCWYFLCDMVNNCNNINGAKQVYQTCARVRTYQGKQQE